MTGFSKQAAKSALRLQTPMQALGQTPIGRFTGDLYLPGLPSPDEFGCFFVIFQRRIHAVLMASGILHGSVPSSLTF